MVAGGGKPLNGAGAAAAAGAGAKGVKGLAGAVASQGAVAAWWQNLTGQHAEAAKVAVASARSRVVGMKLAMPVDVKIDFINPLLQLAREGWAQLPPPVQRAAPHVATGLVVWVLQERRVRYHKRRELELGGSVRALTKEKEELLKRNNLLKIKSGSPNTEVEARMAMAVAEATNAAAAAADAAARAATACIFNQRQSFGPGPITP